MKTAEELYQYIMNQTRRTMALRKQYGKDDALYLRNVAKLSGMLELFAVATGETFASYQREHHLGVKA